MLEPSPHTGRAPADVTVDSASPAAPYKHRSDLRLRNERQNPTLASLRRACTGRAPGGATRSSAAGEFLLALGKRVRTARDRRSLTLSSWLATRGVRHLSYLEAGEGNVSIVLLPYRQRIGAVAAGDVEPGRRESVEQRLVRRILEQLPRHRLGRGLPVDARLRPGRGRAQPDRPHRPARRRQDHTGPQAGGRTRLPFRRARCRDRTRDRHAHGRESSPSDPVGISPHRTALPAPRTRQR